MSRHLTIVLVLLVSMPPLFSQLGMGWEQIPLHGAYRFDNSYHEAMHIQPGGLEFFQDTFYVNQGHIGATEVWIANTTETGMMESDNLVFSKSQGGGYVDRIRLDYNGLSMINGASWPAFDLEGSTDGELRLYNGSGVLNVYAGNTSGGALGSISKGAVYIYDQGGSLQAGMSVNLLGQGVLFADIKNFRMPHPHKTNKEIWYASLEGPEAGAYDRGTAQLIDGEAFIPYSEHYQHVANPETMTVQLTPHHWDTYGLAVITKSKNGFYVKELKGGNGSFAFDWEVKCVRAGHEDFEVIRDADDLPQPVNKGGQKVVPQEQQKKSGGINHIHSPSCALSHKK